MAVPAESGVVVPVRLSDESALAMRMLGLEGQKLAQAMRQATSVDLFRRGLLSIGQAAELAAVSLAEFADVLASGGVPLVEYTELDAQRDIRLLECDN